MYMLHVMYMSEIIRNYFHGSYMRIIPQHVSGYLPM